MTIVKHPNNPLKIQPMSIYFLYNRGATPAQFEMVMELGRFNSFTLGIYDYYGLFRNKHEEVSEELKSAFESNNIIVQLADEADGDTAYLFETVEFSDNRKDLYVNIATLVSRIAEAHLKYVKSRIEDLKRLDRVGNSEKIEYLNGLCSKIESAIGSTTSRDVVKEIDLLMCYPLLQTSAGRMRFLFVVDFLCEQGVPSRGVSFAAKELIDMISRFPTQLAKDGVVTQSNCNTLPDSGFSEERVSISIERVSAKWGKKSISKFGILVTIGEHQLPICFDCKDQSMLYFSALIRYKMGQPLYVHELYNNSRGVHSIYRRETSIPWLNAIFNHLYGREKGGFKSWINKVQDEKKKGRALHQAKSQIKRIINEQLLIWPSIAQSLCIDLAYDLNGDSYYTFGCLPENISICSSLQKVLDQNVLE